MCDIWWNYGIICEDKGEYISRLIIKKISEKRKISEKKARELMNKIAHPTELTSFIKERLEFLKACKFVVKNKLSQANILKNKEFNKLYQEYNKKFFFTKTDFKDRKIITPKVFIKEIYLEIKNKNLSDVEAEIKNMYEKTSNISRIRKETINSTNLGEEEKRLISLMEQIILWMDYRKEGMMKQFYYFTSFVHEFGKRKKETYSTLEQLTLDELINWIDDRFKINKKIIEKRKKEVMIVYRKGKKRQFIYGKKAKELLELIQYKSEEIKGTVASTGGKLMISGKARIVMDAVKDQLDKGEILVTSMTRIEFVPLLKKALAIVTNEGGMAYHAAIVSRELNIPCITGTKNATKNIKNDSRITLNLKTGEIITN